MAPEIQTFLLAMTPIGELRISLPIALTVHHLNWPLAYLISVIGNLVPVVFILLFLNPISTFLSRNFKIFQKFFSWLFEKTRKKYNSKFGKIRSYLALIAFVALPLPMTGGWTASIIASLFGIPFKSAFLLITLGIIIAGFIVSLLTFAGIAIERYFGWQVLLGILLVAGLGWLIYNKKVNEKN